MWARRHSETLERTRAVGVQPLAGHPRRRPAHLAVIVGAATVVILGAVGGAELPGQDRASGPPCVGTATDPCPPPVEGSADLPSGQVFCHPAGIFGQHCYRR